MAFVAYTLDNVNILKCSPNGKILKRGTTYNDTLQIINPDPVTGTYTGWFLCKLANQAYKPDILREMRDKGYMEVPEEEKVLNWYTVQDNMLYVEFEGVTEEQLSKSIKFEVKFLSRNTNDYTYKITSDDPDFLTPESTYFLSGYPESGTNDPQLTTTLLPRQDKQFTSITLEDTNPISYTMNPENTRATVDATITGNVTFTAVTEDRETDQVNYKTITQTTTNFTMDYTEPTVVVGDEYTINCTAQAGYRFKEVNPVRILYIGESGSNEVLTYGVRDTQDHTKASITFIAPNSDIKIRADTEELPKTKTITQQGTNYTIDYTDPTVVVGETYTINGTAKAGYIFADSTPIRISYYDSNNRTAYFYGEKDKQDPTKASITFKAPDSNIKVLATLLERDDPIEVVFRLTNCSVEVDGTTYYDGDTFIVYEYESKYFKFTANTGYEFISSGSILYEVTESNPEGSYSDPIEPTDTIEFTEYVYFSSVFGSDTKAIITLGATEVSLDPPDIGDLGTFANIYKVSEEELKELSKVRFVSISEGNVTNIDYGKYINSIYYLPFELDPEIVTPTKSNNIILGEYNSKIPAHGILKPKSLFNMGTITINEKYNNVYDYKNTECTLYLPFNDPIKLNTEYCINQTLTINYVVDFYSGDTTVNIYSTLTNNLIYSSIVNVSQHIPFLTSDVSVVDKRTPQLNNTITTPFIEVTRNIPYNVNSLFGKPVIDYAQLNSFTGYIEVENIILNVNCTENEKEQIKNILTSGINIK